MQRMHDRAKELLRIIAEQFIEHAQPVGSKFLVEKHGLAYSPATVRNEMKALEDDGYLTHPHISAGRILTEKGWMFYIENILEPKGLTKKQEKELLDIISSYKHSDQRTKAVARHLADTLDETAFAVLNDNDFYYTGLSNLFRKPEFATQDQVINISEVVDHFDVVLQRLYGYVRQGEVQILLGKDHLFGPLCSTIVGKTKHDQLVGIVGPMRMNYQRSKPYVAKIIELLHHA